MLVATSKRGLTACLAEATTAGLEDIAAGTGDCRIAGFRQRRFPPLVVVQLASDARAGVELDERRRVSGPPPRPRGNSAPVLSRQLTVPPALQSQVAALQEHENDRS